MKLRLILIDSVILLIAIHTALSILRPGKITQESGLFIYRYQAYACLIVFSFLLPSLAFVSPDHDAYVSQGTFCTLPVRPFWYRLVLSWIPRYLILITIMIVYINIYVYARRTFGTFNATFSSGSTTSTETTTTKISKTGLEKQVSSNEGVPQGVHENPGPNTWKPSPRLSTARRRLQRSYFPSWMKLPLRRSKPIPCGLPVRGVLVELTSPRYLTSLPTAKGQRRLSDPVSETVFRTPTLEQALHDPSLLVQKIKMRSPDPNIALRKRHKAIQRQLRYMFVYPLVYLLLWIPAFINHCYFYTKTHDPPYVLNCIALACLYLQCAVDCLIFGIREKPWRYRPEGRKIVAAERDVEMRPLKSGGEGGTLMISDQGVDRQRRDVSGVLNGGRPRQEKHWWDEEGIRTPLQSTSFNVTG